MKNVLYVGNALSKKGKTVTAIERLSDKLNGIYSLKIASSKSNKIFRMLDMIKLVVRNRDWADYILIDTYSTSNFYYALIISQLARLFNIQYIPILHGGNLEYRLINSKTLSKIIFNNAYKLVAPSGFLLNVFKKHGYSNIVHIPNAIEIEQFVYKNRDIQSVKLFWLRSFSKIYNPRLAILVLENLIQKGYSAELVMVGPDSDGTMDKVKRLANKKNLNITFTGRLAKQEWIELSNNYNIFINTTNFDNMPVSVIEAMALGLPVVSTNVGGLPILIDHEYNGLLVAPNDSNAMCLAIIRLIEDKNLKDNIVKNARKKVEEFKWEVVRHKWENLLS